MDLISGVLAYILMSITVACGPIGCLVLLCLLFAASVFLLFVTILTSTFEPYMIAFFPVAFGGPFAIHALIKYIRNPLGSSQAAKTKTVRPLPPRKESSSGRSRSRRAHTPHKYVSSPVAKGIVPDLSDGVRYDTGSAKGNRETALERSGGFDRYDSHGNKIGYSLPDPFGGFDHYDLRGDRTGYSLPDPLGGYIHYNARGKEIGRSEDLIFADAPIKTNERCQS